jgi:hypothetical protein
LNHLHLPKKTRSRALASEPCTMGGDLPTIVSEVVRQVAESRYPVGTAQLIEADVRTFIAELTGAKSTSDTLSVSQSALNYHEFGTCHIQIC